MPDCLQNASAEALVQPAGGLAALQEALQADLNFHGSNGRQSAHSWHPFPAKFPPQLPQLFIERLTEPGDLVVDPMFGSGTTLLEALRLGRNAIGCDIDPLARLIAEAKLSPLNGVEALRTGNAMLERAAHAFATEKRRLQICLDERFDAKTRGFVDYWFLPEQQLELIALLDSMESMASGAMRKFFQMVFSSTIIAKSGGVSLARDLAHTRPHRVLDKQPKSAFAEFRKKLRAALSCHEDNALGSAKVEIQARSAEQTDISSASVDLIVTSPPYANNAIDYMRAHKFSLVWLGWKIDDLSDIRGQCLGHDAATAREFHDLPAQCENTIAKLARLDAKKAAALRRYFGEMSAVIGEMRRILKVGKAAAVVVGTSNLRGLDVETHKGLAAIGEQAGLILAGIGIRRLDRDKRMMPARWGSARRSQIENRMHEEYVLGFFKP